MGRHRDPRDGALARFETDEQGLAVCQHRDLSCCPDCQKRFGDTVLLVTLSGDTYYCPTKVERRTMQRVVAAYELGDYSCDPETIYRQELFRERFLARPN